MEEDVDERPIVIAIDDVKGDQVVGEVSVVLDVADRNADVVGVNVLALGESIQLNCVKDGLLKCLGREPRAFNFLGVRHSARHSEGEGNDVFYSVV